MKRFILVLSLVLLASVIAKGQQRDVTFSVKTSDGAPKMTITNLHGSPLEAFVISVDFSGGRRWPTRIFYDVHANFKHDTLISDGASKDLPLPRVVSGPQPAPILRAVIFADGTTVGEESWVNAILERRSVLLEALQETSLHLKNISERTLGALDAVVALNQALYARKDASDSAPAKQDVFERKIWREQVFQIAITHLEDRSKVAAGTDNPQVPQAINHLNRHFNDWMSDLRSAKRAPSAPVPSNL